MNILLINHYAGSKKYGMEYRPYFLACEWVRQGHQVTIVGASFSHLRLINPAVEKDYQEEMTEGVRYIWFITPEYKSSIRRIINILIFVRKLYKYARKLSDDVKPDLVIASSTYPLDNYPAYKIAKMSNAQYTYEVHDLWPLSPMEIGGYPKWHPFIVVMQRAEIFAYKHVNKVVSLLDKAEPHMREHGLPEGKFVWVTNGYFPEDWKEDSFKMKLPEEHEAAFEKLKGKVIVGFAGGLAASGSLDTLINAAALLKNEEKLHVVLVGKGPEKENLLSLVKKNQLNNVTFLPPVQKKMIPALDSRFDICYIAGVRSKLTQYGGAANKLTDYMLCEKPIVVGTDETNTIVERLGCGLRAEAENPVEMAENIKKIINMTPEDRHNMGLRGKKYVEGNLAWSMLAEKFINAFK